MAAGELDVDLGTLLLSLSEEMERESPKASGMLRGLQARYLDLFERLEAGPGDLMSHSRGVSQLVALQRSIRLAATRDGSGRKSSPFSPPAPAPQRRSRSPFEAPSRPASGTNGGQDSQHGASGEDAPQASVGGQVGVDDEDSGRGAVDET